MLSLFSDIGEHLKRNFYIPLVFAAYIVIGQLTDIGCPFARFLHIKCPACGMTRAVFALFRGDFAEYVRCNAMALPVATALAVFFILPAVKNRKLSIPLKVFGFSVLVINFIYYILRYAYGIIP